MVYTPYIPAFPFTNCTYLEKLFRLFFFFLFNLSMAAPVAYGSSQVRNHFSAAAEAYATATCDPSYICEPCLNTVA